MAEGLNAWQAAGFDPEAERRERAKLLVIHQAAQVLWRQPTPVRTTELTQLDGTTLFLGLVRRILRECEYLVLLGRRWDFRWRQEALIAPLGGLVTSILRLKGTPITVTEVAELLAPLRGQPADQIAERVALFVRSRLGQTFFALDDERFGLTDWLPDVEGATVEEAKEREFWQREAFADWLLTLVPTSITDAVEATVAMLDAAAMPLSHRELLFALWANSAERWDSVAVLGQILEAAAVRKMALGYCATDASWTAALKALIEQSDELQTNAMQRARHGDVSRILAAPPSPKEPTVRLSQEDADEIVQWLAEQPHPVALERVVEQVLEVLPLDPDYAPTLRAVDKLLRSDPRFAAFGTHCWWLADKTPTGVHEVPSVLVPPPVPAPPANLAGQFDLVLPVDALDEDLRQFVQDPAYEEVGERDDVIVPSERKPTKRLDIAVTYPHLLAGTLKIRRIDEGFFAPEPPLQFLLATDETQVEVPLWVNLSLGLLFGLREWYQRHPIGVGGIVRLERAKSGQVQLRWTNRYDRWLHIPPSRLDELCQFAAHETIRQAPLVVLLQSLLTQHPQGVHFLRLWSELNVLRRTTKRVLASLLCAYPMFTRVPHQPGFWTMDFNKIGEGVRDDKRVYLQQSAATS